MSAVRQVGIKMVVDAQSVTTELPKIAREFASMGAGAEQGAARATRSLAQVPEAARADLLQKLLVQYGTLAGKIRSAEEAQGRLDTGTCAWRASSSSASPTTR